MHKLGLGNAKIVDDAHYWILVIDWKDTLRSLNKTDRTQLVLIMRSHRLRC